jgi:hypothetical protein
MAIQVALSILDGKGKTSHMFVNLPSATSVINWTLFASTWAAAIDAVIGGQITNIGVCYRFGLPGGIKASPDADSDVEEGGRMSFRTANNWVTKFRIPTFLESKLLAGTKQMDLTDGDVDGVVDLMIDGEPVGGAEPCDEREDDIETIEVARELFVKDRGV